MAQVSKHDNNNSIISPCYKKTLKATGVEKHCQVAGFRTIH